MSKKFISVSQIFDITVHCEVYSSFERKFNYASSDASIISRAGGRTGLAGQGRTGQAGRGRGRMSVRPCRPWWYHISGHYPCVYAEIETSKLNIRLQSTVSLSIQARSTDHFDLDLLGMGSFFCTKDRFNNKNLKSINIAFINFLSHIFLEIYHTSCGKSCFKYIP